MKFLLIVFLLLTGCAQNNLNREKPTCQNEGMIDFMYINIPCEGCLDIIKDIMDENLEIFNYEIIQNKENHILINYCYNYSSTSAATIEESLLNKGFPINQSMTEQQQNTLQTMCCSSQ